MDNFKTKKMCQSEILNYVSDLTVTFSEKFKLLRMKSGYTQKHLAEILCVSRSTLCAWEHADSLPYFDTLNEICRLFDVSCDYILGTQEPDVAENSNTKTDCIMDYNNNQYLNLSMLSEKNTDILLHLYNDLLMSQNGKN